MHMAQQVVEVPSQGGGTQCSTVPGLQPGTKVVKQPCNVSAVLTVAPIAVIVRVDGQPVQFPEEVASTIVLVPRQSKSLHGKVYRAEPI
jgi:hypothetical protein